MRTVTHVDLNPGKLSNKVEKMRAAIERGDLKSADVRKLAGHPYHRASLDDAARLIVQFRRFGDEPVCLLLEVLPNHDYDRSRFLRGAAVDDAKLEPTTTAELATAPPLRYLHPSRPDFVLLDKPISLDDDQHAALAQRPPALLVGSAGSGKSALLLQRLRAATGRVAYVTESRWLAETARALYVAFDGAPPDQEADFLSYQQLLETVHVPSGRPVAFRDFAAFYARHGLALRFTDAHALFEEVRGVLTADPEGPLDREAYLALGIKQSLYPVAQRDAVYDLFERYREYLRQSGLYEPNLVAFELLGQVQPAYDLLVVDEVQDLTNVQLALILRTLLRPGSFVIAGDANQIVHPNAFSWSKVKSLFWRGIGEVGEQQIHLLTASYRNSPQVTAIANRVLRLKNVRFGSIDRESNNLMRAVGGNDGTVASLAVGGRAAAELDQRTCRSTATAVIVLREEDKAEARRVFKTPLLFCIHECKGLEYETVILYRLIGKERGRFADLAADVEPAALDGDQQAYRRAREKSDKSLELNKFFVNSLYVALTRAVRHAYLIEDEPGHPLLRLLGVAEARDASGVQVRTATADEWQREASKLEAQGKLDQAESIRRDVLKQAPVPWTVFDRAALPELLRKATDAKVVATKLRQQIMEFAHFHGERLTCEGLYIAYGAAPPVAGNSIDPAAYSAEAFERERKRHVTAALSRCFGKSRAELLRETERYGVDHRTQIGLTPLMLAAYTGAVGLVEELRARGADVTLRDHLGRQAMHWALRGALDGRLLPADRLGTIYDLCAPAAFDVEVDGRMVQVGRQSAEYALFQLVVARQVERYQNAGWHAVTTFSAALLDDAFLASLPDVVWKQKRKTRVYLNHLLSRACVGSSYTPCRQLWRRTAHGQYELNPALLLREGRGSAERWSPLPEVLGTPRLEHELERGEGRSGERAKRNAGELIKFMASRDWPLDARQLRAAAAMAPGMSHSDLVRLKADVSRPLPRGATTAQLENRERLHRIVADIEAGVIGPYRIGPPRAT